MLGDVNNLFVFKSLLTMPSNVLVLHLKQAFPPIIWIFTEGEGDGNESRLPFLKTIFYFKKSETFVTKFMDFLPFLLYLKKNTQELHG